MSATVHAGHVALTPTPSMPSSNDNETYRMMVLRIDQSEEEVDRHFLQTALDLGITIPQSPRTTIDLVTHDIADLSLKPPTPEPSLQSSSVNSDSTHARSDSSADQRRGHAKTPSLTATSVTSIPSVESASSSKSNYAKVKKGFRRFSTIRRRKTLAAPVVPPLPLPLPPQMRDSPLMRPALTARAATIDQVPSVGQVPSVRSLQSSTSLSPPDASIPDAASKADVLVTKSETQDAALGGVERRRRKAASYIPAAYDVPPPRPPPIRRPPPPREPHPTPEPGARSPIETAPPSATAPPTSSASRSRTLTNPVLKKLRTSQLQEQLRFISFQASQSRLMHAAHLQAKRTAVTAYKARQSSMETAHADALTGLEHRHLSAEMDLRKGLEAERHACDTRLKHMQAYCNPRSNVEGMPVRQVTKADYTQLEQQYHVRNGMENLHVSKINVLREKQEKQLMRIMGKQEAELEDLESRFEQETVELEQRQAEEERSLSEEFEARKRRLIKRWDLAEAIERRKLELQTGEEFGRMSPVSWGEGEPSKNVAVNGNGSRERGSKIVKAEAVKAGEMAGVGAGEEEMGKYDARNMI